MPRKKLLHKNLLQFQRGGRDLKFLVYLCLQVYRRGKLRRDKRDTSREKAEVERKELLEREGFRVLVQHKGLKDSFIEKL